MSGNTTEAKGGELLRLVVRLQDVSNLTDRSFILVVLTHEVQGLRGRGGTVRSSIVDSKGQVDLPAGPQVVHE